MDCEDGSDEENCTVVKLRPDYRRGDPPRLEENVTNLIGETRLNNLELTSWKEGGKWGWYKRIAVTVRLSLRYFLLSLNLFRSRLSRPC